MKRIIVLSLLLVMLGVGIADASPRHRPRPTPTVVTYTSTCTLHPAWTVTTSSMWRLHLLERQHLTSVRHGRVSPAGLFVETP